jgi:hypothetical protein
MTSSVRSVTYRNASRTSTTPRTTGLTSTNSGRRRFEGLHDDLLELALSAGNLDEGPTAALLGRMVGHIQFMGLQLRSDPARPTLIDTQYSPWNWGNSNPDTLYLRRGSVTQTTIPSTEDSVPLHRRPTASTPARMTRPRR